MFREKNLYCGIVGGYGPVEIATGGDAFPVSRREMISMFVAGKTPGSCRVSCGVLSWWMQTMELHIQSSVQDWTYSGSLLEVLSVEPEKLW